MAVYMPGQVCTNTVFDPPSNFAAAMRASRSWATVSMLNELLSLLMHSNAAVCSPMMASTAVSAIRL